MVYCEAEDILHLVLSEEQEANSVELSPGVTAELNDKGEMIGVEIFNASVFLRNSLLESFQFRLMQLPQMQLA